MLTASTIATAAAVTIDRKPLADALKVLAKVTERRNTVPISAMVRVTVSAAGGVEFMATDFDLEVAATLEGAAAAPGAMLIETHVLKAALAKVKGARVRLADTGGGAVTLTDTSNGATVRLSTGCKPADFPLLKRHDVAPFDMDAGQLRDDLGRVAAAISTDETRYYLNGVYFHVAVGDAGAKVLRMAATDGHRLVRVTRPLPVALADYDDKHAMAKGGTILPRKAVALIRDIIGTKPAGEVSLGFAPVAFTFAAPGFTMRGKLIDGTFPDYSRVIPSDDGRGMDIDATALGDAVASATAHCGGKDNTVALTADAAGWVTFTAFDVDTGRSGVMLEGVDILAPATKAGATGWNTGFNPVYVRDMVGKVFLGVGTLAVRFFDDACPALFTAADAPHVTAVLMPKRTDGTHLSPDGVRRLHRTAAEAFAEDFGAKVEGARRAGAALAGVEKSRADKRKARALGWSAARQLIAALREYLSGSLEGRALRLAVKAAAARACGDDTAAARADREAAHVMPLRRLPTAEHAQQAPEPVVVVSDTAADVPAPGEAVSAAPEPVAANDDAPAAAPAVETIADRANRADLEAIAALEAAGCPEAGEADCEAVWSQYVATIMGATGPDRWAIATGRKQADRKAVNRGKLLISHDAYRALLDRFHALPPMLQHAPAPESVAETVEAAAAPVVSEPACHAPALDAPVAAPVDALAATVAALAARLALVEARTAPATTSRPPRTAAHVRAIRSYLAMRASRAAARAVAVEALADAAAARADVARAQTNEAATREAAQRSARDAIDTASNAEYLRGELHTAEGNVGRLNVELERVAGQLAATAATAAADRAELERLAPLVAALAALNPASAPAPLAMAA